MKATLCTWEHASPAAGVIVAIVSAIAALAILYYTRNFNRRRATLDMIMSTLSNEESRKIKDEFRRVVRECATTSDCSKIAALCHDDAFGSDDRVALLNQLNVYELMALGIRRGLFDEALYKRWYHNQFMKDYESSQAFVHGLQERKATLFCECSALYKKWVKIGHPQPILGDQEWLGGP